MAPSISTQSSMGISTAGKKTVATVNLSKQNIELIEGMIQSGDFSSADDVVKAALNSLNGNPNHKLIRLRKLIDEAFNSGEPEDFDIDSFLQEMRSDG